MHGAQRRSRLSDDDFHLKLMEIPLQQPEEL